MAPEIAGGETFNSFAALSALSLFAAAAKYTRWRMVMRGNAIVSAEPGDLVDSAENVSANEATIFPMQTHCEKVKFLSVPNKLSKVHAIHTPIVQKN